MLLVNANANVAKNSVLRFFKFFMRKIIYDYYGVKVLAAPIFTVIEFIQIVI